MKIILSICLLMFSILGVSQAEAREVCTERRVVMNGYPAIERVCTTVIRERMPARVYYTDTTEEYQSAPMYNENYDYPRANPYYRYYDAPVLAIGIGYAIGHHHHHHRGRR